MQYRGIGLPSGSRFLVTGAAGFIGSNLVETLLNSGYRVRSLDNLSTGKQANIDIFGDNPAYEFIEGDVTDYQTCVNACAGVDYVLHQAALGSVPRSIQYPLLYENNNIKGTANIFEAARQSGVKRVVYASSSSVYGDSKALPKKEGEEGKLLSPYAVSKKTNELYGSLYSNLYGLECIGLRYFNVFGRRQDPKSQYAAAIPKFIELLKNGKQVEIHGDGEQSRDFTYIDNVIEANLRACIAPTVACGEVYNIAFGERFTINQIYQMMSRLMNIEREPIYIAARAGDIKHSLADISKARELLGYNPIWDFKKGFKETIEYFVK